MTNHRTELIRKIIWAAVFSISVAFIESAVVVYLRTIYYPEGFVFPLKPIADNMIGIELLRESATMLMLVSVAVLIGKRLWERFAYFLFCFGMWDIFYYVWLKTLLDWPSSVFEWDILFLMPLPWIGPVIAPVSVSILMIIFSLLIIHSFYKGHAFKPALTSYILASAGTAFILFSFMRDTNATLRQQLPQPYLYLLLFVGELLYASAFMISYLKIPKKD